jgi:TolB-like protein
MVLAVFLALAANPVFSQAVAIETALSNAAKEIAASVPQGTKIAVLNISSDYGNLSDYIIDELIVNLVNARSFQVVPRSTVELALARREFAFQMSGDVSDESQKRLGQFLGAGAIVSGSITRDSANSYRLVVNAIDLESFTYQTSYRISIQNNKKMKELVTAAAGGAFNEDYTPEQRWGASGLNLLFGAGSFIIQHDTKGGSTTALVEGLGAVAAVTGYVLYRAFDYIPEDEYRGDVKQSILDSYFAYPFYIGLGTYVIGAVYGIIRSQMYSKPGAQISQNNVPFNLELVSSNNQEINGVRILYNMSF